MLSCSHASCNSACHRDCYNLLILTKNGLDPLADPVAVARTKKHHAMIVKNKASSGLPADQRNIPWDKDGAGGPDDPATSESVILDWWASLGNYKDFCNGKSSKTKLNCCQELSDLIRSKGAIKVRNPRDILNKIQW